MSNRIEVRGLSFGDRKAALGFKDGNWLVQFRRQPTEKEGKNEVVTQFGLSDDAMQAIVQLYLGFSEPLIEKKKV